MDLVGRAKSWIGGSSARQTEVEPEPYRVQCPAGHVIRGHRLESYQAIRCPTCSAGVFILPNSPLPIPPSPPNVNRSTSKRSMPDATDDRPIPLSDHLEPAGLEEADGEIEWIDPIPDDVAPGAEPVPSTPDVDPVEVAVAEAETNHKIEGKPGESPSTTSSPKPTGPDLEKRGTRTQPRRRPQEDPPGAQRSRTPKRRPLDPASEPLPTPLSDDDWENSAESEEIFDVERTTLVERLQRNGPTLVALTVLGFLVITVVWTIQRNIRRDDPALVNQGLSEGIEALDDGDFDRAHQLLGPAATAAERLGVSSISGGDRVTQAAREAAIYVDLIPEPLEEILESRASATDLEAWNREFERRYNGKAILIESRIAESVSPGDPLELEYLILAEGVRRDRPRRGSLRFDQFELFRENRPEPGLTVVFGARLDRIELEQSGNFGFILEPESGVTMTSQGALRAIGWGPIEGIDSDQASFQAQGIPHVDPILGLLMTVKWPPQELERNLPRSEVRRLLGAPERYGRSASRGEFIEQWIYDEVGLRRQFVNFRQPIGVSSNAGLHSWFLITP